VSGAQPVLKCAICLLLNTVRDPREGETLFKGVLVCGDHLREIRGSSSSPAARAVKDLVGE
jgi:hypothetical protein